MNLRILPSEFLLAGYGDYDVDLDLDLDVDLVAQAEADFGIESAGGGAPSFDDILSIPDPFEAMESTMAAALDDGEFCFDQLFSGGDSPLDDWYNDVLDGDEDDELDSNSNDGGRKTREPNAFPYRFGDVYEANWYRQYLRHGDVRNRTIYLSERDRFGEFRCQFRLPLKKVDELVSRFLDEGWIRKTRRINDDATLRLRAELLILGALSVLAHHTPFRKLRCDTEISTSEHRAFFHHFIDSMYSIKDEYIFYPRTPGELKVVMDRYVTVYLPGCGGSIDVVHLKWSSCPAGDINRCTGKEGFPTVSFQVISGFDREILGISQIHFGTRNDQHIVRIDDNVTAIRRGWYKEVEWEYKDIHGRTQCAKGVYLICDGGYLRWPTLICPINGASSGTLEGYFSENLESIRKDVECVFGILKKRWKILEFGIRFRSIVVVEKVFTVCSMLHNMMLSEMETRESSHRVGRGQPLSGDSIWLDGPQQFPPVNSRDTTASHLAMEWGKRRKLLAAHLEYVKRANNRPRTV